VSQPVRAYLPGTSDTLARLCEHGELPAGPAYAVTPALRELVAGDDEELEYEAFTQAAQASVELLRAAPQLARRRVVVSVDAAVEPARPGREPGGPGPESGESPAADRLARVRLWAPVPLASVAAVHVDGAEAEPAVAAVLAGAATEVPQELLWYDVSELARLADPSDPSLGGFHR
jgi:hypothetical protein